MPKNSTVGRRPDFFANGVRVSLRDTRLRREVLNFSTSFTGHGFGTHDSQIAEDSFHFLFFSSLLVATEAECKDDNGGKSTFSLVRLRHFPVLCYQCNPSGYPLTPLTHAKGNDLCLPEFLFLRENGIIIPDTASPHPPIPLIVERRT